MINKLRLDLQNDWIEKTIAQRMTRIPKGPVSIPFSFACTTVCHTAGSRAFCPLRKLAHSAVGARRGLLVPVRTHALARHRRSRSICFFYAAVLTANATLIVFQNIALWLVCRNRAVSPPARVWARVWFSAPCGCSQDARGPLL